MYTAALFKVLPVLLLLLLGYGLGGRSFHFLPRSFLSPATLEDLKKLVVNVTLPAVLFLAFASVTLQAHLLVIPAIIFSACVGVFVLARRLSPLRYEPHLLTGFEAGMLGYAIFGAVYGQENIYKFGLIDLGQVVFVFFVLVPTLQRGTGGPSGFRATLRSFLRTPVILAIAAGVAFNASGLYTRLADQAGYAALVSTLNMLGAMTTPLVLLVIGAQLAAARLDFARIRRPLRTAALRLLLWAPAGALFAWLVVGRWLHLDPTYQVAALTLVILPPPFVIPLYLKDTPPEDAAYVVNTLSLFTLVTIAAFALLTIFFPPG